MLTSQSRSLFEVWRMTGLFVVAEITSSSGGEMKSISNDQRTVRALRDTDF